MVHASVIGCGNMGSALIEGFSESGGHRVVACDIDEAALAAVEGDVSETTTDLDRAATADVLFLAVKPNLVAGILEDLTLSDEQTVVSIAAGVPTAIAEDRTDATVVRLMPNLAAANRSMAAAVTGDDVPTEVREMLTDVGVVVELEEPQMDLATAINGSGPAFVYYLIKAMQDVGVAQGMAREDARLLAAQTFKGAAEIVLDSEESLESLIERVCSPKGTTIEGMAELRDSKVEETIAAAVIAAAERSNELVLTVDDE